MQVLGKLMSVDTKAVNGVNTGADTRVKVSTWYKTPPDVTRISKRTDGGLIPKKTLKFLCTFTKRIWWCLQTPVSRT